MNVHIIRMFTRWTWWWSEEEEEHLNKNTTRRTHIGKVYSDKLMMEGEKEVRFSDRWSSGGESVQFTYIRCSSTCIVSSNRSFHRAILILILIG